MRALVGRATVRRRVEEGGEERVDDAATAGSETLRAVASAGRLRPRNELSERCDVVRRNGDDVAAISTRATAERRRDEQGGAARGRDER